MGTDHINASGTEKLTRTDLRHSQPQTVPYLLSLPEVVDVSVGRQLFVDDYLIQHNGQGMARYYHKPVKYPANPVLWPQTLEECDPNYPPCAVAKCGGVWYDDQDQQFKMWYMSGYLGYMSLATSDDGILVRRNSRSCT
jgi:hypothetical protein